MTVVILAGDGDSTWIVHNALRERFPVSALLIEPDPPALELLRRRARRIGWVAVVGQVAFVVYARLTRRFSTVRRDEILRAHGLSPAPDPEAATSIPSANSREAIALLQSLRPEVVVVNGTRILSQEVLDCVDASFLNMHAGITPMYRGVHGCYWALANGDEAHAGVTIHLVDAGVDTGGVIAQAPVQPTPADSYHTYPFLQIAAGLPLLEQAVADALAGRLHTAEVTGESRLYYHPTIWRYAINRVQRGVR